MTGNGIFTRTPMAGTAHTSAGRQLRVGLFSKAKPIRKSKVGNTFGTIFHSELSMHYKAMDAKPDYPKLTTTLRGMREAGVQTVVYSVSWNWAEPEPGKLRTAYLDGLMHCACRNAQLKVFFIIDILQPPAWIWARYPDARARDSDGRVYSLLSWFHTLGQQESRRFLGAAANHLKTNFPGCMQAIQPVFNNEYEAKFTQEYDAYQDYSPYALAAFRDWLRAKRRVDLQQVNLRWETAFTSWPEVTPPRLHAGYVTGLDFRARYWDWIKFREEYGAAHINAACAVVQAQGLQCFHHFPEFFSVIDAMYGATMFRHIASSPHTDFLIMDSNFRTPYGTIMNPVKLRMYVSAALPYGKPVYFEAAVERYADMHLLEAGFQNSLLAGAENLGITNWHGRISMNSSLAEAMGRKAAPACKSTELVGVFLHLDSCAAFHGLQHGWRRKDPLHDFVEDLAERLTAKCGTDIAVYIELDLFLHDMSRFTRAVFVEPLILYDSAEFVSYANVKAALQYLPHDVLYMPGNITAGGAQFVVLQDLKGRH